MSQLVFAAFSNRLDAVELARESTRRLEEQGIASSLHFLDSDVTPQLDSSSLVISLGGDGTFLRAARLAHEFGASILAVNLGRLGFLLNVPSSELIEDVKRSMGSTQVVERLALQIRIPRSGDEFAFNEVVVERAESGRMVRVQTFVGDEPYLTYSADGVMVATPTGSTGYNFSVGGPVVDTTLGVMVLTPIAAHFTIDRSIVVGGDRVLRLTADGKPAIIVADGRTIGTLYPGESIEVRRNPRPVRVVATRDFELGFRLRESLREGHA